MEEEDSKYDGSLETMFLWENVNDSIESCESLQSPFLRATPKLVVWNQSPWSYRSKPAGIILVRRSISIPHHTTVSKEENQYVDSKKCAEEQGRFVPKTRNCSTNILLRCWFCTSRRRLHGSFCLSLVWKDGRPRLSNHGLWLHRGWLNHGGRRWFAGGLFDGSN